MLMLQRRVNVKKTNESYAIGHIHKHQRTLNQAQSAKIWNYFLQQPSSCWACTCDVSPLPKTLGTGLWHQCQLHDSFHYILVNFVPSLQIWGMSSFLNLKYLERNILKKTKNQERHLTNFQLDISLGLDHCIQFFTKTFRSSSLPLNVRQNSHFITTKGRVNQYPPHTP